MQQVFAIRAVYIYGEYSSIGRASDCGSEGCGIVPHYSPQSGLSRRGVVKAVPR